MGVSLADSNELISNPHEWEKSLVNAVDMIIDVGELVVQQLQLLI